MHQCIIKLILLISVIVAAFFAASKVFDIEESDNIENNKNDTEKKLTNYNND